LGVVVDVFCGATVVVELEVELVDDVLAGLLGQSIQSGFSLTKCPSFVL
jgi:hypothetical protein